MVLSRSYNLLFALIMSLIATLLLTRPAEGAVHLEGAASASNHTPLNVEFTYIHDVVARGAVCLDGSPAGYNFHPGHGAGANSWMVDLPGGAWCYDVASCLERRTTFRGSTRAIDNSFNFTGKLSNKSEENPEFFMWNRIFIKYCDGASFDGDGEDKATGLQFRGQQIFRAAIEDLMAKGMRHAEQALLSGGSVGGVAVVLLCDTFRNYFPGTVRVKCLSDAGLFIDTPVVAGGHHMRSLVHGVVTLQGVQSILPDSCTNRLGPVSCFFPEHLINFVRTPMFILNAAYDIAHIQAGIAPNSSDPYGHWNNGCKLTFANCSAWQIDIFQQFRKRMLESVQGFSIKRENGVFINSCYAHSQGDAQDTWFSDKPPMIDNKGISESVRDWYFDRSKVNLIGPPYPYDKTCHNQVWETSPW